MKGGKQSSCGAATLSAHTAERAFFPLDKALALLPGELAPHLQEKLVRLGSWLPFGPAAQLFSAFTGVAVSESTARRLTEAAGAAQVAQEESRRQALEKGQLVEPAAAAEKLVLSVDGAMVPLVGGEWAEVRTLAIGQLASCQEEVASGQPVVTGKLSYFSRLMEAEGFQRAALVETERRGLTQAQAVAAVSDGAEWIPNFVDYHRPDALRILDFPHAAERLTTVYQRCREAGLALGEEWPALQRQRLKSEGGSVLLAELRSLQEQFPQLGLDEPLAYLAKREAMLDYPRFQAQGWPIGSGAVESANKLVVEARLKGAGMHWHRQQVNPMLALRNVVCNDRWQEEWPLIAGQLGQRRRVARPEPAPQRPPPAPNLAQEYFRQMRRAASQQAAHAPAAEHPQPKQPWRPPPNHPWRKSYQHPRAKK